MKLTDEQRKASSDRMKALHQKRREEKAALAQQGATVPTPTISAADMRSVIEEEESFEREEASFADQESDNIADIMRGEDRMDAEIDFIEKNTAKTETARRDGKTPVAQATIDAEKLREKVLLETVKDRREEKRRQAQMWERARRTGAPLPAVSLYSMEMQADPTRVRGRDGQDLVGPDEIGEFISMEDPDSGKQTYNGVQEALARPGSRVVRYENGKPVKRLNCTLVAYKAEESARHLAMVNEKHFEDPLLKDMGIHTGRSLFAQAATAQEMAFVDEHDRMAEEMPQGGRRRAVKGGAFEASAAIVDGQGPTNFRETQDQTNALLEQALHGS